MTKSEQIMAFLRANPGQLFSLQEIADVTGLDTKTVSNTCAGLKPSIPGLDNPERGHWVLTDSPKAISPVDCADGEPEDDEEPEIEGTVEAPLPQIFRIDNLVHVGSDVAGHCLVSMQPNGQVYRLVPV